ncbi:ISNCY family transposase [Candidatus Magnetominusculus dajiuhuensis]|uniref:ISNCY family transposase n=1 Tax=Candidatus Magnetominusculus dajiuhuensis TaxID=3137712 RepID=UPI003B42B827
MAWKDRIEMSIRDLKRLKAVQVAMDRRITQREAAEMLGVSERQIRRLIRSVRDVGAVGIVHKGRGRESKRKTPEDIRGKAIEMYETKYNDFGPTLAAEKLLEHDGIEISDETLRGWLICAGLWQKRRKRAEHRRWRERKGSFGEMVQLDGSHHDWLEGRGPELVLMGYIDDATGNVYGRFYDYEGTMPAMDSFKRYVKQYGVPMSVYSDRHTTYKSNGKLTPEEELEGKTKPLSQFERALEELGVELIHAYSPQAKGRIERLFGVLQDRLVKEMRIRGIKSKDEANEFLKEYFPKYNKQFRVCPANETDVHVKPPRNYNLDKHLCIKTPRVISNDNTVSNGTQLYQIEEKTKEKNVVVEDRVDGSMRITCDGKSLRYSKITVRPIKERTAARKTTSQQAPAAKDHPWRKSLKQLKNKWVWANAR